MSRHSLSRAASPLLILLAMLAAAPAARADVTASSVTSPQAGTMLTGGPVAASFAAAGTATVNGGAPTTVDLRCTNQNGASWTYSPPLPGGSDLAVTAGQWSAPSVTLPGGQWLQGDLCRLRAVPHLTNPADPSPYAGPVLVMRGLLGYAFTNSSLVEHEYDFVAGASAADAIAFVQPLQSYGLETDLVDAAPAYRGQVFGSSGVAEPGGDPSAAAGTPSLSVDGHPAYTAAGAYYATAGFLSSLRNYAGFPVQSETIGPAAGADTTVAEHEAIAMCGGADPDAFPIAGGFSCSSFQPSGIRLDTTTTIRRGGHVVEEDLSFASTDGLVHQLSIALQQHARQASATHREWRFPGEGAYATHVGGDAPPVGGGVGSFLVRTQGAADGDLDSGLGALTWSDVPAGARFSSSTYVDLHYARSVPAAGTLTLRFSYATEATATALEADRVAAEALFSGATPPATDGGSGPAPAATPAGSGAGQQTPAPSVPAGAKLGGRGKLSLRHGKLATGLTITCPGTGPACRVSLVLRAGKRKLGGASVSVGAGKTAALRLKLGARAATRLRAAVGGATLSVKATRAGAPSLSATRGKLRLRVRPAS